MRRGILKKCYYFFIFVFFCGLLIAPINNFSSNVMGIYNIKNINSMKGLNKDNPEKIIYVDDKRGSGDGNPPENYTKIEDALNSIEDDNASNTVVYVYNGTYKESITISKPIKCLKGGIPYLNDTDKHGSIIDATDLGEEYVVYITGPTKKIGFNIDNFVIHNSHKNGIYIRDPEIIVSNCIISNCADGLVLTDTYHCNILYNNITNNSHYGISLEQSYWNVFEHNNISDNDYYGICLNFICSQNEFSNNIISHNKIGGIFSICSPFNNFEFNNIFNNKNPGDPKLHGLGLYIVCGFGGLCGLIKGKNNWWGADAPSPLNDFGDEIRVNLQDPLSRWKERLFFKPFSNEPNTIYDI